MRIYLRILMYKNMKGSNIIKIYAIYKEKKSVI